MKTMPAGELKARCLKALDQARAKREPVILLDTPALIPTFCRGESPDS